LERIFKLDSGGGGPTIGGGSGNGGDGDGRDGPHLHFEFMKPPAAIARLEAFDHTAKHLQEKLSRELEGHDEVSAKNAEELQGYGCLNTYRKNVAAAVSSFKETETRHGAKLVACYLLDAEHADVPMAIYKIYVDFKGRRGIDYATIEDAIYRPGVTKGDHASESVSLSRKGARYVRRFGFDKLRMWISEVRGWVLSDIPPSQLV
jgi:hypothetical protein